MEPEPEPAPAPITTHPIQCGPQNLTFYWYPADPEADPPITTYSFSIGQERTPVTAHLINAPETGFTADGLVADLSYNAFVQASNDYGSTFGIVAAFDTTYVVSPPTQAPVTATATRLSDTSARVEWTAPSVAPKGKAYYFVKAQSSDPNDPGLGFSTQDLTQTGCIIDSLNDESTYTFIVSVKNAAGSSPGMSTNPVAL